MRMQWTLILISLVWLGACKQTRQSQIKEEVAVSELEEAEVATTLKALGAKQADTDKFCGQTCHGSASSAWHEVTRDEILNKWLPTTQKMAACFAGAPDAKDKIACFQDGSGQFTTDSIKALGVYRVGAKYAFFKEMFTEVYGEKDEEEYQKFLKGGGSVPKAQMPTPNNAGEGESLSEEEFLRTIKLFTHPNAKASIEKFFGAVVVKNEVCQPLQTDYIKEHIDNMRYDGWGSRLMTEIPRKFYGCSYTREDFKNQPMEQFLRKPIQKCFNRGSEDPSLKKTFLNWEKNWAEGWDRVVDDSGRFLSQKVVVLSNLKGCLTTFWMRSSADGRYVGNGNRECNSPDVDSNSAGFIMDLKYDAAIGVNADYDPGFFPDNKGFTFIAGDAYFCSMEALNPGAANKTEVPKFFEIKGGKYCGNGNLGVYQHVGAAVDPADPQYTIVRSDKYANDDGGASSYRNDPSVGKFAVAESYADLYKMCEHDKCGRLGVTPNKDGDGQPHAYGVTPKFRIDIAYEGDYGISPSSTLLTSRIARKDGQAQLGYALRTYDIDSKSSDLVGRVCIRGGKASMSFDERFMVTHHFTDASTYLVERDGKVEEQSDWKEFNKALRTNKFSGPEDPEFVKYIRNSSNIWLADLKTGKTYRLTFMNPGQFALYPHFRADGWMYFLVRDYEQKTHFVVATDAALQIALKD